MTKKKTHLEISSFYISVVKNYDQMIYGCQDMVRDAWMDEWMDRRMDGKSDI